MEFEVRQIATEEFPTFARTNYAGFGAVPSDEDIERNRPFLDLDRSLAAYDAGRMVGTATAFAFDLTLPGGSSVPVAAVSWVAVLPTDRRRGVLRAMMRRQLEDTRQRGEPLAVLTASESGIYGRFGYGQATSVLDVEIERVHTALRARPKGQGHVRFVSLERALDVFPTLWDRHRRTQPGALSRPALWWEQVLRTFRNSPHTQGARFYALYANEAGEPEGGVWYRIEEKWELGVSRSSLVVGDLIALTDEARSALWNFVFSVDLIATVVAGRRPVDDPLPWMLADPRRLRVTQLRDDLWVRLLDIPAALAARRYAGSERLVLEVSDPFLPENAGRYLLEVRSASATCRTTSETPDLALEVADLGAAYLGGVSFVTLARAGRVYELQPGALQRADALFTTPTAPFSGTGF